MNPLDQLSRPCGAALDEQGRCTFTVWAPNAKSVQLVFDERAHPLQAEPLGFFTGQQDGAREGQRYAFRLDGGPPRPDPASRWQPDGVHAASAVIRLEDFPWTDQEWRGIPKRQLAIYELHVGTFTPEGTFDAVIPRLPALKDLGVTALEIMPVAQFPGARDWGYDGVHLSAVQNTYGGPRGLQRLVDAAHRAGLAVILDVVYNHLGPEGNYLREFGPYFNERHHTPWGAAVNYDDRGSDAVRAWVLHNVRMWIRDFHFDGLRLDAVQTICDDSPRHILAEIAEAAHAEGQAAERTVHVIAETDQNDVRLIAPRSRGGFALDAVWSDDFHHALHALLTGERQGYYSDFSVPAQQLAKAFRTAFVFDGVYSPFRGRRHGSAVGDDATCFVVCAQNHDQVGNRAAGDRMSTLVDPPRLRLAAGLTLLSPYLPLLFMGEEYGEQRPFAFFCSFSDRQLNDAVRRGRRTEAQRFGWPKGAVPDPAAIATFAAAKLSWSWPDGTWQSGLRRLYATLLHWRRERPELQGDRTEIEVAPPTPERPWMSLQRRAPGTSAAAWEIWFNLSDETIELSADSVENRACLLRSEDPQFGGAALPDMPATHLLPYEFVILTLHASGAG
jgi:maltooligosyltrehalose trehalohydrolase